LPLISFCRAVVKGASSKKRSATGSAKKQARNRRQILLYYFNLILFFEKSGRRRKNAPLAFRRRRRREQPINSAHFAPSIPFNAVVAAAFRTLFFFFPFILYITAKKSRKIFKNRRKAA
jgi:hypothetical protein